MCEQDWCKHVQKHTRAHTHTPQLTTHFASTRVYSIITILQSLWTWPRSVLEGGVGAATYQPDHVCLLDRLCVFRHSAAMQSSVRGNQLQSVMLSCGVGEESLHLSVLMNKDSDVWFWSKEPSSWAFDLSPAVTFPSKVEMYAYTPGSAYHLSWGTAANWIFYIIINELIFRAVALVT